MESYECTVHLTYFADLQRVLYRSKQCNVMSYKNRNQQSKQHCPDAEKKIPLIFLMSLKYANVTTHEYKTHNFKCVAFFFQLNAIFSKNIKAIH